MKPNLPKSPAAPFWVRSRLPNFKRISIGLSVLCVFGGCASTPPLSRLPQETIQRKPILPEGVASWRALTGFSWDSERNSTFFPFYWEQGVSDRLTWIWSPIPLDFQYLLWEAPGPTRWVTVGASLLGSPYSREKNFDWRPSVELQGRTLLSQSFALDGSLLSQFEVKRASSARTSRTLGLRLGPLLQIEQRLSLLVSAWVLNEAGTTRARYLGALPPASQDPSSQARWRFPLEFQIQFNPSSRWSVIATGQLHRLGYEPGYTGSATYFSFVHYW